MSGQLFLRADNREGGKCIDHPGFQKLLSVVEQGRIDVVAVYKLDRAFRSFGAAGTVVEKWKAWDVSFHAIQKKVETSSTLEKMFLGLLSAFAEQERDFIKERITSARETAKQTSIE